MSSVVVVSPPKSPYEDTSPPTALSLAAFLCAFDHATFVASAVSWLGFYDLQTCGLLAFLYIFISGAAASFIPRSDTSVSRDRRARMAAQGGHTLMWAYFAGFGPIAELVQWSRGSPAGSAEKLSTAVLLHATGSSFPHLLFSLYATFQIAHARPLFAEAASRAAAAAADAAAAVAATAAEAAAAAAKAGMFGGTAAAAAAAAGHAEGLGGVFRGDFALRRFETAAMFTNLLLVVAAATMVVGVVVVAAGKKRVARSAAAGGRTAGAAAGPASEDSEAAGNCELRERSKGNSSSSRSSRGRGRGRGDDSDDDDDENGHKAYLAAVATAAAPVTAKAD